MAVILGVSYIFTNYFGATIKKRAEKKACGKKANYK